MNYNNPLTSIDTANLSQLGQAQVNEFVEFLRPHYDSIVSGHESKEKVARYYLKWEDKYTDGAKARISALTDALGISKGYLSKIRNADKLLEAHNLNPALCQWIEEHPVTTQYMLGKIPHDKMMDKYLTGNHFTRGELEKVSRETKDDVTTIASAPVVSEFQESCARQQRLIDDESLKWITNLGSAGVYEANNSDIIRGCLQMLDGYTPAASEDRKRVLGILKDMVSDAIEAERDAIKRKSQTTTYSFTKS